MNVKSEDMEELLYNMLEEWMMEDGGVIAEQVAVDLQTFSEAGFMTKDRGIVVGLSNGQQFQITIVRA